MTETIGIMAGIFTTIAAIPQIVRTIKNKGVKDVSPFMFIILIIGVSLWTWYGFLKHDLPIIITNGISTLFNAIMLLLIIKYRDIK